MKLGLRPSTDGRTWMLGSERLLRSETWSQTEGYGRDREVVPGWRLSGRTGLVKRLLDAYSESCLVLSVQVRRRPLRHAEDQDESPAYPQPYARYYLMEEDGVPHALGSSS